MVDDIGLLDNHDKMIPMVYTLRLLLYLTSAFKLTCAVYMRSCS